MRRLLLVLAVVGTTVVVPPPAAEAVSISPPATPVFAGDAPDPHVVRDGSTYYAFTTGTTWGNHIGVLVSNSPSSGWKTLMGGPSGSSAFRSPTPGTAPASWQVANTQVAPGAFEWGGRWVLYYAAQMQATGYWCLSVATAPSPSAKFTDRTGSSPLLCQDGFGGAVDPSPFVDDDGRAWLVWKSNHGSPQPARLWIAPLSADGLSFTGPARVLVTQDTTQYPWQTTIENPQMARRGGVYYLFFSAGQWDSASYAQTYATCATPDGPCTQPRRDAFLSSYASVLGPGGGAVFADANGASWLVYHGWSAPCTAYSCGGARRMHVAALQFPAEQVPCDAPSSRDGYRMFAADGGVFTFGALPYCGSMGGAPLARPIVGAASTPTDGGYWLAAGDGGIFAFGDARFFGSTGAMRLNKPIVGMASTPSGNGYWLLANDGGIFAFGDAQFYGSTGAIALREPVFGLASTPNGHGYWLVASDGGVFAFGDAGFHGSTGGSRLGHPIVAAG